MSLRVDDTSSDLFKPLINSNQDKVDPSKFLATFLKYAYRGPVSPQRFAEYDYVEFQDK